MALIEARIYPPIDDLLFLQRQHKHRTVAVYEGNPEEEYDFRRRDKGLFDLIRNDDPHPQVWEHLHNAGFGGVFQCGWRRFDHGLLTALIERWRPETHTFHFPVGEATITLQDVQVLWGLPINGPAMTGKWESRPITDWVTICVDWLGFLPEERRVRGGAIDINYLVDVLEQHPVDVNNPLSLEKRARLYILALLGGCLFSDSSSRGVSLNYVTNIMDLTVAGRKSWGSATLSHLYRQLCKAATIKGEALIAGPLMLVMVWAWERMIDIAPRNRNVTYAYNKPYAARWSGLEAHLSYSDTPQHAVRLSRMMITAMEPNKVETMQGRLDIPNHVVLYHILPRLPVTSLQRFRSVCKQWHSFLKTRTFANIHSHHVTIRDYQLKPKTLVLSRTKSTSFWSSTPPEFKFRIIDYEAVDDDSGDSLPLPFKSNNIKVVSSLHGLVCVGIGHDGHLVLWNPLTGEYKNVNQKNYNMKSDRMALGLYYNTCDDDYKLLLVSRDRSVYIYSLKSNSWRIVNSIDNYETLSDLGRYAWWRVNTWLNGDLYFLYGGFYTEYSIIKFDIKIERFTVIPTYPFLNGLDDISYMDIQLWGMIRDWKVGAPYRPHNSMDPLHCIKNKTWFMINNKKWYTGKGNCEHYAVNYTETFMSLDRSVYSTY